MKIEVLRGKPLRGGRYKMWGEFYDVGLTLSKPRISQKIIDRAEESGDKVLSLRVKFKSRTDGCFSIVVQG